MDISVVILNWNSKKHLERCLPSLINSLGCSDYSYEIFVIDNGSADGSVQFLNEVQGGYQEIVKPILLQNNTGTTFSRNLALKAATGDYLVILDSDVEVPPDIINYLVEKVATCPDIGLIVPKLVYPSGALQKSTDVFPTVTRKVIRFFFLKWMEKKDAATHKNASEEVDYAISAFWVLPKKILSEVGYLDENIFYAPEDVDYCLRIQKCGFKIVYEPTVSAIHHAQEISRGFKFNRAFLEHVKGLLYFYNKHRFLFRRPVLLNHKGKNK